MILYYILHATTAARDFLRLRGAPKLGVFEFCGIYVDAQRSTSGLVRNRCLEPPGSDSSRIPISLYFITSYPRAHSRHRRSIFSIIAASTVYSESYQIRTNSATSFFAEQFSLITTNLYFSTLNESEVR